jgi:aldehyde:ferredoxin oxidoreductase
MFGKILAINLTKETYSVHKVDFSIIRAFIGGKGLGAYLLYTTLKGGEDPLSPANPLMFLTGPLTGTFFPTSGRSVVVSKSPLTGTFADSHFGGYFGPELRRAGYDGLIITGRSKSPRYVWISGGGVEFKDAGGIQGLPVDETVRRIRKETDAKARVACIGPAGENLVKFAAIMMDKDGDAARAGIAARAGLGAVMGSKNLKAVAVRGTGKIQVVDEEGLRAAAATALQVIKENTFIPNRTRFGTSYWVEPMNRHGILPTRNFRAGFMENAERLYAGYLCGLEKKDVTCFNCPIRCGKKIHIGEGPVKVEYEDIALLGSDNGIKTMEDVAKALMLCNNLGLDAISAGNVVGFAMECGEKGILRNMPGFGDAEGQRELIRNIAYRRGIGDILADGVREAARKIGRDAEKFAMHVKGMEIPGYEPRSSWGMALAYATSDRGACHQRAWTVASELAGRLKRFSFEGVPAFVKDVQDERAAAYSLIVCDFAPIIMCNVRQALKCSAGIDLNEEEYIKVGERIWNLTRLFNAREGMSRKDDTLPVRIFEDPLPVPGGDGIKHLSLPRDKFERALDEYYALRGWDVDGIPTREKLRELGLDGFYAVNGVKA